jgi:signal transduction histidine kinase
VTIAMGYLELSLEENKNREIIPYLTKIEESLIIIRKIIENARLFAKLQNTDELDREDLDISRLIKDSMSAMNSQAHKKKIRINFIGSDGLVLQANDNLGRVFSNLLSNAIKFSPSQSQILVSLTELPSKVLIQVKDQGPGIPDEHKSKIFQRLEKLDCKNEGSGLGLFIVKKILDLHHGKVWIDDNPDGGSIFNVELPIN